MSQSTQPKPAAKKGRGSKEASAKSGEGSKHGDSQPGGNQPEDDRGRQADASPDDPQPGWWRESWAALWRGVPAWMFSAVVHAFVLVLLALLMIRVSPEDVPAIISSSNDDDVELVDDVELLTDDKLEVEDPLAQVPDPGAADLGSLVAAPQAQSSPVGVGELSADSVGDLRDLFSSGKGMSEIGIGDGAASFFGVKTKGRKFIFVVDNSNSMGNGKFETAVSELVKSVNRLNRYQQFYVIFFSDTAYPLFYPKPSRRMVPATEDNKRKLEYWLRTVHRCLRTKGEEAMQLAFSMRPDAVYVLGDGSFTDKTVEKALTIRGSRIIVHTLGFRMKPQAERDLRLMAKHFGGKFTEVQITPAMVQQAKRLDRPKNRTRNGVWGIKLPAVQKKKN